MPFRTQPWKAAISIPVDGTLTSAFSINGMVRFTGCGLFGTNYASNGTALARIAGTGRVSFDNCHFYCIHPESRNAENMIVDAMLQLVNAKQSPEGRTQAGHDWMRRRAVRH